MTNDKELQLIDLAAWARVQIAGRAPDFKVGEKYLDRRFIIPRNDFANVYLHEMNADDDDRALHDHPYDNASLILAGGYLEHVPDGPSIERKPGDFVTRKAEDAHRLELYRDGDGKPVTCLSLFLTGPRRREWGFHCPNGWIPWQEFVDPDNTGEKGRGCGD